MTPSNLGKLGLERLRPSVALFLILNLYMLRGEVEGVVLRQGWQAAAASYLGVAAVLFGLVVFLCLRRGFVPAERVHLLAFSLAVVTLVEMTFWALSPTTTLSSAFWPAAVIFSCGWLVLAPKWFLASCFAGMSVAAAGVVLWPGDVTAISQFVMAVLAIPGAVRVHRYSLESLGSKESARRELAERQDALVEATAFAELNEDRFRRLAEATSEGVLILEDRKVVDVNPQAEQVLQASRGELLGRDIKSMFPSHSAMPATNLDSELADVRADLVRVDGESFPAELHHRSADSAHHSVFVFRDLTDFVAAEEALSLSEKKVREQLTELEHVYSSTPVGLCLLDRRLNILRANKRLHELGVLEDPLPEGQPIHAVMPAIAEEVAGYCDLVEASGEAALDCEFWSGEPDTRRHWLADFHPVWPLDGQGAHADESPLAVSIVLREITARKLAEWELRESKERYELAAKGANDGLWDWDLRAGTVYYSERWRHMVGCDGDGIGNSPTEWSSRLHPADLDGLETALKTHLDGGTPHFAFEYRIKHSDESYRWMLARGVAVRDSVGNAYRMAGSQTDISDRKRAERRLLQSATHDSLTSLPNRLVFLDRLARSMARYQQSPDQRFAVVCIDVDRFKLINDSLGHLKGDEFLVIVSDRLRKCVRERDTLARLGGDEFMILLDRLTPAELSEVPQRVANRILEELAETVDLDGHEVSPSASIGIASIAEHHRSGDELMRDADAAMYEAKAGGRGAWVEFTTEMNRRTIETLELDSALRRSIERDELRLAYQPILSLSSDRVIGVEALLRWQHPEKGAVSPAEFIPLAEESGFIVELGLWVLQSACRRNLAWQEEGLPPIPVWVNISGRQLQQLDLVETIEQTLEETGLEACWLGLEFNEGAMLASVESGSEVLGRLSEIGVRMSLDNYGTGYSSLNYLERFSIDTLKISEDFIRTFVSDSKLRAFTTVMIDLAHSLRLQVIAEGVESEEQLDYLREHDCDAFQGYIGSRPIRAEEFADFHRAGWGEALTKSAAQR